MHAMTIWKEKQNSLIVSKFLWIKWIYLLISKFTQTCMQMGKKIQVNLNLKFLPMKWWERLL